jgi:alkaline phosphatase D
MITKLLSSKCIFAFLWFPFFCVVFKLNAQTLRTTSLEPCLAPFYHGVASGDPMPDRVIIWTRVTPDTISSNPVLISWQMATDTGMTNIVQGGSLLTDNTIDYTVKVDAAGLMANTWYYYEFSYNGQKSPRGRTRTTPLNGADSLRFAIVSCANLEAGFFNSYKVLLNRADFDAVICLGDYIYEYQSGGYSPNAAVNRQWLPANEILSLNDYRQRYSTYHLDDDLRRLHQQFPFITIWDDHESANDSWMNGAENHTAATEGPFAVRKANAKQAYFEWLPIRQQAGSVDPYQLFRKLSYGNLVDFIMLDTRLHGRDLQAGTSGATVVSNTRQLLGSDQFTWLGNRLDSSSAQWKVLTQQVMIAPLKVFGQAVNGDQWDGYPAERTRVFNHILNHNITNVIAVTGDIHSSWANDLPTASYNGSTGAGSAGVEFVGPSVTSPGMSIPLGVAAIQASNSHIKYADLWQHGFMILDINTIRTQNDWYYINTIDQSSGVYSYGKSMYVNHAERFLRPINSASMPRNSIYGIMAPNCPRVSNIATGLTTMNNAVKILNVFPNPAQRELVISFLGQQIHHGKIIIYNSMGQSVYDYNFSENDIYNNQLPLNISSLAKGLYNGSVEVNHQSTFFKFVKESE